jgi:hypothetical protein
MRTWGVLPMVARMFWAFMLWVSWRDEKNIVRESSDLLRHELMRAGDNQAVKLARPPLVQCPKGCTGGTSGLHRTA